MVDLNMPEYSNVSTLEKNLSISGGDQGMRTETEYLTKQSDYSADDDYALFHDAHEDMVPGERHYFDTYEDVLSGEGHYFDLSDLNKNEAFGFAGREDANDDGLVRVATPKDKDMKSRNRGDDVSPCPLESWTRHSVLGVQPIYPLVQYGTRKTLVKRPGSSDWIKRYLKDIDMLASMVRAFMEIGWWGIQEETAIKQGHPRGTGIKPVFSRSVSNDTSSIR
jgi:hypothetical protein